MAYKYPALPQPPDASVWERLGDYGVDVGQTVIGMGEALVGLADIPSGGHAGKGLQAIGWDPKKTREILSSLYSDERQFEEAEQSRRFEEEGILSGLKYATANPASAIGTITQSLPLMYGGRGIATGAMKMFPKLAPAIAGGIGEGMIAGGMSLEQIRQQTEDGTLSPEQYAYGMGAGALTGALGYLGGKVAGKLGIADVDVPIPPGTPLRDQMRQQLAEGANKSLLRRIGEGAISEGLFEELPQSIQEQVMVNLATGKEWNDGINEAAGLGLLTGAAMGGGMQGVQSAQAKTFNAILNRADIREKGKAAALEEAENLDKKQKKKASDFKKRVAKGHEAESLMDDTLSMDEVKAAQDLDDIASEAEQNVQKIEKEAEQLKEVTEVAETGFTAKEVTQARKLWASYQRTLTEQQSREEILSDQKKLLAKAEEVGMDPVELEILLNDNYQKNKDYLAEMEQDVAAIRETGLLDEVLHPKMKEGIIWKNIEEKLHTSPGSFADKLLQRASQELRNRMYDLGTAKELRRAAKASKDDLEKAQLLGLADVYYEMYYAEHGEGKKVDVNQPVPTGEPLVGEGAGYDGQMDNTIKTVEGKETQREGLQKRQILDTNVKPIESDGERITAPAAPPSRSEFDLNMDENLNWVDINGVQIPQEKIVSHEIKTYENGVATVILGLANEKGGITKSYPMQVTEETLDRYFRDLEVRKGKRLTPQRKKKSIKKGMKYKKKQTMLDETIGTVDENEDVKLERYEGYALDILAEAYGSDEIDTRRRTVQVEEQDPQLAEAQAEAEMFFKDEGSKPQRAKKYSGFFSDIPAEIRDFLMQRKRFKDIRTHNPGSTTFLPDPTMDGLNQGMINRAVAQMNINPMMKAGYSDIVADMLLKAGRTHNLGDVIKFVLQEENLQSLSQLQEPPESLYDFLHFAQNGYEPFVPEEKVDNAFEGNLRESVLGKALLRMFAKAVFTDEAYLTFNERAIKLFINETENVEKFVLDHFAGREAPFRALSKEDIDALAYDFRREFGMPVSPAVLQEMINTLNDYTFQEEAFYTEQAYERYKRNRKRLRGPLDSFESEDLQVKRVPAPNKKARRASKESLVKDAYNFFIENTIKRNKAADQQTYVAFFKAIFDLANRGYSAKANFFNAEHIAAAMSANPMASEEFKRPTTPKINRLREAWNESGRKARTKEWYALREAEVAFQTDVVRKMFRESRFQDGFFEKMLHNKDYELELTAENMEALYSEGAMHVQDLEKEMKLTGEERSYRNFVETINKAGWRAHTIDYVKSVTYTDANGEEKTVQNPTQSNFDDIIKEDPAAIIRRGTKKYLSKSELDALDLADVHSESVASSETDIYEVKIFNEKKGTWGDPVPMTDADFEKLSRHKKVEKIKKIARPERYIVYRWDQSTIYIPLYEKALNRGVVTMDQVANQGTRNSFIRSLNAAIAIIDANIQARYDSGDAMDIDYIPYLLKRRGKLTQQKNEIQEISNSFNIFTKAALFSKSAQENEVQDPEFFENMVNDYPMTRLQVVDGKKTKVPWAAADYYALYENVGMDMSRFVHQIKYLHDQAAIRNMRDTYAFDENYKPVGQKLKPEQVDEILKARLPKHLQTDEAFNHAIEGNEHLLSLYAPEDRRALRAIGMLRSELLKLDKPSIASVQFISKASKTGKYKQKIPTRELTPEETVKLKQSLEEELREAEKVAQEAKSLTRATISAPVTGTAQIEDMVRLKENLTESEQEIVNGNPNVQIVKMLSPGAQRLYEMVSKAFGAELIIVNGPYKSRYRSRGRNKAPQIILNVSAPNLHKVYGHELFHHIVAKAAPEQYNAFKFGLRQIIGEAAHYEGIEWYKGAVEDNYSANGIRLKSDEIVRIAQEEFYAEMMGEMVGERIFYEKLAETAAGRTLAGKLLISLTKRVLSMNKMLLENDAPTSFEKNVLLTSAQNEKLNALFADFLGENLNPFKPFPIMERLMTSYGNVTTPNQRSPGWMENLIDQVMSDLQQDTASKRGLEIFQKHLAELKDQFPNSTEELQKLYEQYKAAAEERDTGSKDVKYHRVTDQGDRIVDDMDSVRENIINELPNMSTAQVKQTLKSKVRKAEGLKRTIDSWRPGQKIGEKGVEWFKSLHANIQEEIHWIQKELISRRKAEVKGMTDDQILAAMVEIDKQLSADDTKNVRQLHADYKLLKDEFASREQDAPAADEVNTEEKYQTSFGARTQENLKNLLENKQNWAKGIWEAIFPKKKRTRKELMSHWEEGIKWTVDWIRDNKPKVMWADFMADKVEIALMNRIVHGSAKHVSRVNYEIMREHKKAFKEMSRSQKIKLHDLLVRGVVVYYELPIKNKADGSNIFWSLDEIPRQFRNNKKLINQSRVTLKVGQPNLETNEGREEAIKYGITPEQIAAFRAFKKEADRIWRIMKGIYPDLPKNPYHYGQSIRWFRKDGTELDSNYDWEKKSDTSALEGNKRFLEAKNTEIGTEEIAETHRLEELSLDPDRLFMDYVRDVYNLMYFKQTLKRAMESGNAKIFTNPTEAQKKGYYPVNDNALRVLQNMAINTAYVLKVDGVYLNTEGEQITGQNEQRMIYGSKREAQTKARELRFKGSPEVQIEEIPLDRRVDIVGYHIIRINDQTGDIKYLPSDGFRFQQDEIEKAEAALEKARSESMTDKYRYEIEPIERVSEGEPVAQIYFTKGMANMMNNVLARDLIRTKSFFGIQGRKVMNLKNKYTSIEFAISLFHAMTIGQELIASTAAWRYGRMRREGKISPLEMIKSFNPVSAIQDSRKISALMEAVLADRELAQHPAVKKKAMELLNTDNPDVVDAVIQFYDAGGLLGMDKSLRSEVHYMGEMRYKDGDARVYVDDSGELQIELPRGDEYPPWLPGVFGTHAPISKTAIVNSFKSVLNQQLKENPNHKLSAYIKTGQFAMLEGTTAWLMEQGIPRVKMAVFAREYTHELERQKDKLASGQTTKEMIARDTMKFLEDRFGEVNWQNTWMNPTYKTALQFAFRSFTWFTGSWNALAKAGIDVGKLGWFKIKGEEYELTNRGLWAFNAVVAHMMAVSLMYTAFMIGAGLSGGFEDDDEDVPLLSQLLFPRTDVNDPEKRIAIPSYVTEWYKLARHLGVIGHDIEPSKLISGRFNSLLGKGVDVFWNNADFRGVKIRNEADSVFKQTFDAILHLLPLPISVASAKKNFETKGFDPVDLGLASLGMVDAPASAKRSSAANKAYEIRRKEYKGKDISSDEMAIKDKTKRAAYKYARGDKEMLQEMVATGEISARKARNALERQPRLSGKPNPKYKNSLAAALKGLTIQGALEVWEYMSDHEKEQHRKTILKKYRNVVTRKDRSREEKLDIKERMIDLGIIKSKKGE